MRQGHGAVAALHPAGPEPGGAEVRRQRARRPPAAPGAGRGACRRRSRRAPSTTSGPECLEGRSLELGPPGGQERVALRVDPGAWRLVGAVEHERGRLHDGLPPGAAAEVGPQRRLDIPARRPARPVASSAARRRTMPGVQKPHWLAPVATKAAAQRSRCAGGSPSTVVTRRPATRRSGVTQATRGEPSTQTVQQPH